MKISKISGGFSYKLSAIITIYLQQGSYKVYLNEKDEKALNTF